MIKIDKNKYPVFFNTVSESGKVYHVFCVADFDALDCAIEVSYYEKKVDTKGLFVVVCNSSYKFVYFYKNFVCYFAEVPGSGTLKKLRSELL